MTKVRVLRVFTDANGRSGNHLGVVRNAARISPADRQAIAAELAYSETVFVDADARLQIFTPTVELPFAGHPVVGAAWLLRQPALRPSAGTVSCRVQKDQAWIIARPEWAPHFARRRLSDPEALDALTPPASGSVQAWAWSDEARGMIRARVFVPDLGVVEDPATGSAAIGLCAELRRPITIDQGPGCQIDVRPCEGGLFELGGRVADDGERVL